MSKDFRTIIYQPRADEGPAAIVIDVLAMLDCVDRAECFDGAESGYFVLKDGREFRVIVEETAGEEPAAEPQTCQHCGEERQSFFESSPWLCGACNGLNGGEG